MLIERKIEMLKRLLALLLLLACASDADALSLIRGGAVPPIAGDAMTQLIANAKCTNCWVGITTQGGQPNGDYQQVCFYNGPTDPNYPGTGAPDYNATVAADNQASCIDNTGAYQGVAYDSHANRFLIGAGGGHSTGFENSIMEFSFSTLKWKRLTTPDDSITLSTSPSVGTFAAVGGIDFSTFPAVMTITSISSGKILVGGGVTWQAWINATSVPNNNLYVASQISGTTGGVGTYSIWWPKPDDVGALGVGNTPGLCGSPPNTPSCNVPPGTTIWGVFSSNQTQSAQTWNGMLLNPACQTNIAGTEGLHDYGTFIWMNGWPDAQGSLLWSGIRAPWAMFTLNTINEANPLPTPVNWQPPSHPTDATGLPTVTDCTQKSGWHLTAGPFGTSTWFWSNWAECTPFCGTGAVSAQIPGTTKIFQIGAGLTGGFINELLYDASKDPGVTSTSIPVPYLNQDASTRPPGPAGPSTNPFTVLNGTGHSYGPNGDQGAAVRGTSLWLLGDYPNGDGTFTGVRVFDMNTGNATDYSSNPSNSDNWVFSAFTPYITYYPPKDIFVVLGTTAPGGTRNTSAYGNVSPGNIFDIVNPTPNGSGQISVSQLVTGGTSMPTDLNASGHSGGYGQKLAYDSVHNVFVLITCSGFISPLIYVYIPSANFPLF